MLNRYTVPCLFPGRVQKRNCYLSVSTLTSKDISSTLFILCFSLNVFVLPFSGILTWKSINHSYLVPVYTQIHQARVVSLFVAAKNVTFTFHPVLWPSKHQSYFVSDFETCKYVRWYFLRSLFASKYVIFFPFFAV